MPEIRSFLAVDATVTVEAARSGADEPPELARNPLRWKDDPRISPVLKILLRDYQSACAKYVNHFNRNDVFYGGRRRHAEETEKARIARDGVVDEICEEWANADLTGQYLAAILASIEFAERLIANVSHADKLTLLREDLKMFWAANGLDQKLMREVNDHATYELLSILGH